MAPGLERQKRPFRGPVEKIVIYVLTIASGVLRVVHEESLALVAPVSRRLIVDGPKAARLRSEGRSHLMVCSMPSQHHKDVSPS